MKSFRQSWLALRSLLRDAQLSFSNWMLVALSGALLFVFSLPNAMALRKLLLLIVFLMAFRHFWSGMKENPKPLVSVFLLFATLQVWMLLIAVFVSEQPWASLSEWKGQWLPTAMSFIAGIGLARILMVSNLKDARAAIALVVVIPVAAFLCINAIAIIYDLILVGEYQSNQYGIGGQKGTIGYLIALLAPILMADFLGRQVNGIRVLPLPVWSILALLILVFLTLIAASSRNGLIILVLAIVLVASMTIVETRKSYSGKKVAGFAMAVLMLVVGVALVSYKIDSRWQTFIETIPVAWDIDRDLLWLNGDGANMPLTPSGQPVDASEYYRIAWAHEGGRMLLAHPWGVEIARDAFQKLVLEKYGQAGMAHTHNSWLDLGLQVGIPGLLLWGWILWLKVQYGWRVWRAHREPLGVALVSLVTIFAAHGLIDSIFRDHEIEQFMLVAGLLFGALSFGRNMDPACRK